MKLTWNYLNYLVRTISVWFSDWNFFRRNCSCKVNRRHETSRVEYQVMTSDLCWVSLDLFSLCFNESNVYKCKNLQVSVSFLPDSKETFSDRNVLSSQISPSKQERTDGSTAVNHLHFSFDWLIDLIGFNSVTLHWTLNMMRSCCLHGASCFTERGECWISVSLRGLRCEPEAGPGSGPGSGCVHGRISCSCILAQVVSDPPWPRRRCRTEWWCPLGPSWGPRRTPGRCRRRRACRPPREGSDAAPRSRNTAERRHTFIIKVNRRGRMWLSSEPVDYLDLVEVLSRIKGNHVVGGDASDGFICGVPRSVESQRRLTWNHLHNNTWSSLNRFQTWIRTRTGLLSCSLTQRTDRCERGALNVCDEARWRGRRSYKDLRLLRSEVPLHAGVSICVEGDLDDAFLHRLHRLHLLCVVAGHRHAAEPRRLTDNTHKQLSRLLD